MACSDARLWSPDERSLVAMNSLSAPVTPLPASGRPLVSAIVSTYNAERFMRGKLEDLTQQTIAPAIEIIIVDSGSEQNELAIVAEFQRRHANITYLRTSRRETVYQAWNRGIRAARGEFVTNANTDDRLRPDCLEILVTALRRNPDTVLAYGDSLVTLRENQTFNDCTLAGTLRWPDFNRQLLLDFCYVGPHPVWRRSVHEELGYFDERYVCAADYEFWLRLALHYEFVHVPEYLGLYWQNEQTVSRKGTLPLQEAETIKQHYRPLYHTRSLVSKEPEPQRAEQKSVLLVVHSFLPETGGVECYTASLAKSLVALGWSVSIFYPVLGQGIALHHITQTRVNGIQVFQFACGDDTLVDAITHAAKERAFSEFLQQYHFDLVHFQHTHLHIPFSFIKIARELGKPVCLTLHDFWPICLRTHLYQEETHTVCAGPDSPEKCCRCFLRQVRQHVTSEQEATLTAAIRFRLQYVQEMLRNVSLISAPSRFLRDRFYGYGFGNGRIEISSLGVTPQTTRSRQKNDSFTFGYIGTISAIKNVFLLTEAFSRTKGTARLLIYGNAVGNSLIQLRTELRDPRIIYLGGYQPEELTRIFSQLDAVVIPSVIESYCFTVREALAAGLPVIAANVGGIPEVVTHGVNGLLFDPVTDDLTGILQRVIDDPGLLDKLTPSSTDIRSIVADALDWQERYQSLIAGSTGAQR